MQKVVFLTKTGMIYAPEGMTTAEAREWAKTQPDTAFQWDAPDTVVLSKEFVEKMAKLTQTGGDPGKPAKSNEAPVRVYAMFRVQDGMNVEVYPEQYVVMVPVAMTALGANRKTLEEFVLKKLKRAAVLTYMADYAYIKCTTCDDYCWGDFMGFFKSLPDIGVYSASDFPWADVPAGSEEVSLEINHDAYPGDYTELPPVRLVFTDKADQQKDFGTAEYDLDSGEVDYTPESGQEGTWELVSECGIRAPVAKCKEDLHDGCGFFFAEA